MGEPPCEESEAGERVWWHSLEGAHEGSVEGLEEGPRMAGTRARSANTSTRLGRWHQPVRKDRTYQDALWIRPGSPPPCVPPYHTQEACSLCLFFPLLPAPPSRFRFANSPALLAGMRERLQGNLAQHDLARRDLMQQVFNHFNQTRKEGGGAQAGGGRGGKGRVAGLERGGEAGRAGDAAGAASPSKTGTGGGITGDAHLRDSMNRTLNASRLPRPFRGDPGVDDTLATILQWLHSKIPSTR